MRSLSYIIILMSLIGNCQSEKISCIQNRIKCCQPTAEKSISKTETQQLIKEFKHFISQYQKHQKQNIFGDWNSDWSSISKNIIRINFVKSSLDEVFELQKKTSIVRNKNNLEEKIKA